MGIHVVISKSRHYTMPMRPASPFCHEARLRGDSTVSLKYNQPAQKPYIPFDSRLSYSLHSVLKTRPYVWASFTTFAEDRKKIGRVLVYRAVSVSDNMLGLRSLRTFVVILLYCVYIPFHVELYTFRIKLTTLLFQIDMSFL